MTIDRKIKFLMLIFLLVSQNTFATDLPCESQLNYRSKLFQIYFTPHDERAYEWIEKTLKIEKIRIIDVDLNSGKIFVVLTDPEFEKISRVIGLPSIATYERDERAERDVLDWWVNERENRRKWGRERERKRFEELRVWLKNRRKK